MAVSSKLVGFALSLTLPPGSLANFRPDFPLKEIREKTFKNVRRNELNALSFRENIVQKNRANETLIICAAL
jgi:hypothetical protein